jgi:hypothetical protein
MQFIRVNSCTTVLSRPSLLAFKWFLYFLFHDSPSISFKLKYQISKKKGSFSRNINNTRCETYIYWNLLITIEILECYATQQNKRIIINLCS